jgi:hypothetical protein
MQKQKVAVMDWTVNHGGSHPLTMQNVHPSAEFEIRHDDYTALLVAILHKQSH